MKSECIILIPIHKKILNDFETKSLVRCIEILKQFKIVLLLPKKISRIDSEIDLTNIEVINISNKYFENVYAYNKLKTSRFFYNIFRGYKFILTYELDSWVFKDELEYWCLRDFDYIGAPWFSGYSNDSSYNFNGVGNSGFSLRKVDKMLEIFSDYRNPFLKQESKIKTCTKNLIGWFYYRIFSENFFIQNSSGFHEDTLISSLIEVKKINIPNELTAMKFSFEMHPSYLFSLNNNELPFGCHAWEKYEPEFWSNYIEINE